MAFRDLLSKPLPSKQRAMMEDAELNAQLDDDESILDEPDDDIDAPVAEVNDMTPEEENEADRVIDLAATPNLLKEVLSDTEVKEFVNSDEFDLCCNEGFMSESFQDQINKDSMFVEGKIYNKTKIQLDKKARFAQLFEISVLGCAKAKNDPDYIKLEKAQKLRRKYKKRLRMKYKGQALKRAKFYLQRLKSSRSGIMHKLGNAISHK